jgi:large subunit ribosomal protein L10
MRAEKKYISGEYVARLNSSPFFIVVDYTGLRVGPMTELRKRLRGAGAEIHVVKNTIFRLAAKEAGTDITGATLAGQIAVVTGQKDVSAAAKVIKTFASEFEKPKLRFGFLNNQRLEAAAITTLADLPPLEVLRAKFLGLLNTPATKLAALLNTPASQLARVLQAKADKEQGK